MTPGIPLEIQNRLPPLRQAINIVFIYLFIGFMLPLYSAGFPNERILLSLTH